MKEQRVTVMGLGHFGGGLGVTRWLCEAGARVLLTDVEPEEKLTEALNVLRPWMRSGSLTLRLGGHDERDFAQCDLVVANPAVPRPWSSRYLLAARHAGVPITTEIRMLTQRLDRSRVIGITGSAGKSTTTAMIHHLLTKLGRRAHLGGNIGGSLLCELPTIGRDDLVVLELSSAMLWWLGENELSPAKPGFSPACGVLTNVAPNHLDWHESFEHYRDSKENIFRFQHPGEIRIVGEELLLPASAIELALPGSHNQRNAFTAATAVHRVTGTPMDALLSLLRDFRGLPHRLEFVGEIAGRRYYNDSKSTTPEATILAVRAFDEPRRIHLIVGGYDKKIDLSPIAGLAAEIAGLYTIGQTGRALASSAGARGRAEFCSELTTAIDLARSRMREGDLLLLSPGCASWDQFRNYEERGKVFKSAVSADDGRSADDRSPQHLGTR